jgi:Secretion system C-terminal sorting domain
MGFLNYNLDGLEDLMAYTTSLDLEFLVNDGRGCFQLVLDTPEFEAVIPGISASQMLDLNIDDLTDSYISTYEGTCSFSNEIESHGYFKYAIQPVYTEEQGQIIYNTAFIYFDENQAVITNTTYSEISVLALYETDRVLDGVVIFPNPNSGNFNITTQEKGHWDLAIYDVYGKLVETSFFAGDKHHMASPIGDGIYLLQLHNKSNGKLLMTKFVMGH